MEVLTPITQQEVPQNNSPIPQELMDAGMTVKNISILDYLGMKEQMFDYSVMNKVNEIADLLGDKDIQELDIMLGNPRSMTKIDKIYTYLKLDAQTKELRRKEQLLEQEKQRYY